MPRRLLLIPKYRVPATPLSIATVYAAAGYGVWQGLGLIFSRPERLGSPSFTVIRHSPTLWGLAALIFGVCVAVGAWRRRFHLKAAGLTGLSAWSIVFASTALNAYTHFPTAAPTAPPAYYFIGAVLAILIWTEPKGKASPDAPEDPHS